MSSTAAGPAGPAGQLSVTSPGAIRGRTLVIGTGRSVVGRTPSSELQIDHPDVSRAHAAIEQDANGLVIEDLGSTNGTTVNGITVDRPRRLRHGDVVGFGPVRAVFDDLRDTDTATRVHAATSGAPALEAGDAGHAAAVADGGAGVRFDIDEQRAGSISNVAGDQYILAQRESFLRQIAAARTRARGLIVIGFVVFLVGLAGQFWFVFEFFGSFGDMFDELGDASSPSDLGVSTEGLVVYLVSTAAYVLGIVIMLVGLVLHIVAAARRRRVDQDPRFHMLGRHHRGVPAGSPRGATPRRTG